MIITSFLLASTLTGCDMLVSQLADVEDHKDRHCDIDKFMKHAEKKAASNDANAADYEWAKKLKADY